MCLHSDPIYSGNVKLAAFFIQTSQWVSTLRVNSTRSAEKKGLGDIAK